MLMKPNESEPVTRVEILLLGGLSNMLEGLAKERPDLMTRDCVQAACIGFESAFSGLAGLVASGALDAGTPGLGAELSDGALHRIKLLVMLYSRSDGVASRVKGGWPE